MSSFPHQDGHPSHLKDHSLLDTLKSKYGILFLSAQLKYNYDWYESYGNYFKNISCT